MALAHKNSAYSFQIDQTYLPQWIKWLRIYWVGLLVFTCASAAIGMEMGDCEDGTPDFLFGGISVVMGVASAWQAYYFWGSAPDFISKIMLIVAIIFGLLDLMDFFTDGQQLALAVLCDDKFHKDFVVTFQQSSFAFVAQVVNRVHMYGLLAISMGVAVISQAVVTTGTQLSDEPRVCVLATYVGLGALSKVLAPEGFTVIFRAPTTGLFENVPGVYLQTSLFGLTFDSTDDKTKIKQLVSLALSGVGMLKMAVETLILIRKKVSPPQNWSEIFSGRIIMTTLCLAYCVASIVLAIICTLRIWFSYVCESHLWNVTSGCVDLNSSAAS